MTASQSTTNRRTTDRAPRAPASAAGRVVHHNLAVPALYEAAIQRDEGIIAAGGPLVVRTGTHTGRSPKDKFVVDEPASHDSIWWGEVNRPISEEHFERMREKVIGHLAARETFVKDAFVGAHPMHRRSVRVTTETAWASLFAHNLFIRPSADELAEFRPDFTIYDAPSLEADPAIDGTRTGTFILVHVTRREVLIGGTAYAGEIKKSAFTVMNYLLPDEGVLPMHSSVNVGPSGDPAIFFGLSGTGKTTLVADPARGRSSGTTSTAGVPTASSTSRAAATPRPSACRPSTSRTSSRPPSASGPSSRTWPWTRPRASWTWTRRS